MLKTSELVFNMPRRDILKMLGIGVVSTLFPLNSYSQNKDLVKLNSITTEDTATSYNNFYEFGFSKSDPAKFSKNFNTSNWKITIDGDVKEKMVVNLSDLIKTFGEEERLYKMRCVEGWSMNIPWKGFELNKLISMAKPGKNVKYIQFESYADKTMPEVREESFPFPYLEGLRLDEAINPLVIFATGAYDKPLLPQNGAPVRLVVPWKYGFKSLKSISKITFTAEMPKTTWTNYNPKEYGFYANVNPLVPHPRWPQARERVIISKSETTKAPTQLFNGYDVAYLYEGMDLKINF